MIQRTLISPWIPASLALPAPGERVLGVYERDDGTPSTPVTMTPIHADGSHIRDGAPIYQPLVRWMPIPEGWQA